MKDHFTYRKNIYEVKNTYLIAFFSASPTEGKLFLIALACSSIDIPIKSSSPKTRETSLRQAEWVLFLVEAIYVLRHSYIADGYIYREF